MSDYHRKSNRGNDRNRYREEKPQINVPPFQGDWVADRIVNDSVVYAEKLGGRLKNDGFTSSQFRNFYGELKRIQLKGIESNISSFHLLKPKLAYSAGRAKKNEARGAKLFKNEILTMIEAVKIDEEGYLKRFNNFCDMVEAVLAYHKAAGGRD